MRDLLLTIQALDYESELPNCTRHLRDARARGWITPLDPDHLPKLTDAGRDALASGIGLGASILQLRPGSIPA
jgi:hypothetical protein